MHTVETRLSKLIGMHIQFGYEKLRITETLQRNKHTCSVFIERLTDIRNIEYYVHDSMILLIIIFFLL